MSDHQRRALSDREADDADGVNACVLGAALGGVDGRVDDWIRPCRHFSLQVDRMGCLSHHVNTNANVS